MKFKEICNSSVKVSPKSVILPNRVSGRRVGLFPLWIILLKFVAKPVYCLSCTQFLHDRPCYYLTCPQSCEGGRNSIRKWELWALRRSESPYMGGEQKSLYRVGAGWGKGREWVRRDLHTIILKEPNGHGFCCPSNWRVVFMLEESAQVHVRGEKQQLNRAS